MDILKKNLTKDNIILLATCVLLPVYMRYSTPASFDHYFAALFTNEQTHNVVRALYHYITMLFLLVLIPLLLIKFLFREKVTAYGLQKGDQAFGFKAVFILLVPIFIVMLITASLKEVKPPFFSMLYPAIPEVKGDMGLFFFSSFLLFLYYFAFEFFYRGFMLFGLRDKFGALPAVLIQSIPSIIIHFDKPDGELFASILAEILFGLLALRTDSIFYGLLIHYFVGVSIELAMVLF